MNINGIEDEFVEVVARTILYKDEQAKGVAAPSTDNWLDLYLGKPVPGADHSTTIVYNTLRAETDRAVSMLLRVLQEHNGE